MSRSCRYAGNRGLDLSGNRGVLVAEVVHDRPLVEGDARGVANHEAALAERIRQHRRGVAIGRRAQRQRGLDHEVAGDVLVEKRPLVFGVPAGEVLRDGHHRERAVEADVDVERGVFAG